MEVDGGTGAPRTGAREALKRRLFRRCDADCDGVLKQAEMRELAALVGFEGTDDEWREEYEQLCSEHGIRPEHGVPEGSVLALLDDDSDTGCFCTDKELRLLLGIEAAPTPMRKAAAAVHAMEPAGGMTDVKASASEEPESSRVYFAGANWRTDEAALRRNFEEAGCLEEFTLFRFPDGRSRGMGRAAYSSPAEAQHAIVLLDRLEVDGRTLMVKEDVRVDGESGEMAPTQSSKGPGRGWKGGGGGAAARGGCGGGGGGWGRGGGGKARFEGRDDWSWQGKGSFGRGGAGKGAWFNSAENFGAGSEYSAQGYSSVFFAGAAFESSDRYLRKQFEAAGRVVQFWLFHLPDGRSRGMGVVQYSTPAEAEYACEILHGRSIDGREILVQIDDVGALEREGAGYHAYAGCGSRWGDGRWQATSGKGGVRGKIARWTPWSNRVFFAGAPYYATDWELRSFFEEFGEIRSFTPFRSPVEGVRHRGMGVCTYVFTEAAQQALRYGIEIDGRPLFMQQDISQFREDGSAQRIGQQALAAGYSWGFEDGRGGGGGPATSQGYGPARVRNTSQSPRSEPYDQAPAPDVINPSKAVFFANVPFDTTETHLRARFETVGPIRSLTLFTSWDGKSRGMGVVEYATQAAASRAYHQLHEQVVSGRSMVVDEYRRPSP